MPPRKSNKPAQPASTTDPAAGGVAHPLTQYAEKRSFDVTPEPPPTEKLRDGGAVFCVQRHAARQLHYDLRLEIDGTLKSWAVPHGPTLDPNEKRLAVLVEDHPLEYATFEGNIPKGQYGGGSMMLWDSGTYEVLTGMPARGQIERGDFKFKLQGHKLKGEFALVRMKGAAKGNEWLLLKKKDAAANPAWKLEHHNVSVKTGRTQDEIAMELPARSDAPVAGAGELPDAVKCRMPSYVAPMLASIGERIPTGAGWLFEIKWDGVRAIAYIKDGKVSLQSRRKLDMNRQYPELASMASAIRAGTAILDGEIVALDDAGRPSFQKLQPRIMAVGPGAADRFLKSNPVFYFVFDILYVDGYDLRAVPLVDRRRLLKLLLEPHAHVRVSDCFETSGGDLYAAAKAQGLEGIMAKKAASKYTGDRSADWLKFKVATEQEFLLCGWTEGERDHFGALALACYDEGKLMFAGTVGTGFDNAMIAEIAARLKPYAVDRSPLADTPKIPGKKVHWTRPELACTIRYHSWTGDNRLRAPVFVALRPDVDPEECVRQAPAPEIEAGAPVPRVPLLSADKNDVRITVEGKALHFTNLGKPYYPQDGIVKRDLINYYDAVAGLLIPHWKDRPLSLRRYPDGIDGEGFFQKHAEKGFPEWMRVEMVVDDESERRMFIGEGRPELLALTNLGCIDQNPWMSRMGSLDHPDFMLIDLDPFECSYDKIVEAAHLIRRKLELLGLESYPKTTGGNGMHLYVPLEPVYTYEHSKQFAEVIARLVAAERPDLFTTPRAVERREKDRVYFDYLQNGKGKTISAPYVLRAHAGAPVATPLDWREVVPGLNPKQFHIRNAMERFDRVGDLFAPVLTRKQRLEGAFVKLQELLQGGAPQSRK